MNDIQEKLYDNIRGNVEAHTDGHSFGYVLETDESNNRCYILYLNYTNQWAYDYADIKLSGSRDLEWFPAVGQMVALDVNETNVYITGYSEDDFKNVKEIGYTIWDIYASAIDNTYGGFNF